MEYVKTKKGTELPLMNLKGKPYLQVAYRIQWFSEEESRFSIRTEFVKVDEEETIAKAIIEVYNEKGEVIRHAEGTKRESLAHFSDHTEKAETGAIGRALISLGYGTQFALADLDEGDRIVDSPVVPPRRAQPVSQPAGARGAVAPASGGSSKETPAASAKPQAAKAPVEKDNSKTKRAVDLGRTLDARKIMSRVDLIAHAKKTYEGKGDTLQDVAESLSPDALDQLTKEMENKLNGQ